MNAWEQRKFGGIINRISKQSDSDSLPKVEFEDIVSGEGRLNKDITNKFDNRKGTVFEPENILYGKLRPYLKNWLYTDFKGIALGDFWVFESISTVPIFNYYLIQAEKYQEVANMSTGTKMPRSDWKIVSEADFSIPSNIKEQEKLGKFFSTLDTTITLHQRKLEKMKELKKAYLQVMFPQSNESEPKLRFFNFADEWTQKRLGDVAEIIGGGTPDTNQEEYWNGDIDWYSPAEIGEQIYVNRSNKKITKLGLQKSSARILPVGTVLFTSRAGIGNMAILEKEGTTNQGFQSIIPDSDKLNSYFIFSKKEELKRYGETVGAGSTFVEVSGKQMRQMLILLPSIDEQLKLGTFFKNLDDEIVRQRQKLEYLQQLKQAYLQKMFV